MNRSEYAANLAMSSRAIARAAVPTPAELERHASRQKRGRAWPVVAALVGFAAIGALLAF